MILTFTYWDEMHTSEHAIVRKFYHDRHNPQAFSTLIADFIDDFNLNHQGEITVSITRDHKNIPRIVFELTEQQLLLSELQYTQTYR